MLTLETVQRMRNRIFLSNVNLSTTSQFFLLETAELTSQFTIQEYIVRQKHTYICWYFHNCHIAKDVLQIYNKCFKYYLKVLKTCVNKFKACVIQWSTKVIP